MGVKLFVGNVHYEASEREVRDKLAEIVGIERFEIARDQHNGGRARGFGFLEVVSQEDADRLVGVSQEIDVRGRRLRIEVPKPRDASRTPRPRHQERD